MLHQTFKLCLRAPRLRRQHCQVNRRRRLYRQITRRKLLGKDPPVGNQNPVVGKKRKSPNNKTASKPKRVKQTSDSEVCPLTTADIPDIVAAVANANHCERAAQVRTSRRTSRSGNRTSRVDPPSGDSQPSSDEEGEEYEDFGKCNRTTRCTLC